MLRTGGLNCQRSADAFVLFGMPNVFLPCDLGFEVVLKVDSSSAQKKENHNMVLCYNY